MVGPQGAITVHAGTQRTPILLESHWALRKTGWIEIMLGVQLPPEIEANANAAGV